MILLVASKKDIAGKNIGKECERLGLKVHYVEEELLHIQKLPKANSYIFLSRHKSKSKKPCLTAHFPGNFSSAKFGGDAKELGFAYPSLKKTYIKNLKKLNHLKKYQIVLEATHHGPTKFKKPVMFVEIGSSKKEWNDKTAVETVANAVKKTIEENKKYKKIAIAFGGTHYPKKFTKISLKKKFALGHIMPKYAIENLDENIFKQMIEKSNEKIKYCLIDWKGCNRKKEIKQMCKKYGLDLIKV